MRILFTTFEGGGHVPPAIVVARRLREQGHMVLFVSDLANADQAAAAGLDFETWRRAPNRTRIGAADDPLNDWRRRWPPAVVRAICEAVITGPAAAYAADALDFIAAFKPDVVVSNELLFGVIAAAERAGVPVALLTANVWCFPTRADLPPFGPGFPPARGRFGAGRERTTRRWIAAMYDAGLADLNRARASLGLAPLARTLDQLESADLIVLGVSAAFDYDGGRSPGRFVYAGPLGEAPAWAQSAPAPVDLLADDRPNVLVSFSTTFQGQDVAIRRCIAALASLPVRGIVTLGPAIPLDAAPPAGDVKVVASAPHDALVPRCAAVICHGGHGTVIRPLMQGTPVLCLPMGRDHPENAQRLAIAGAGLRLSRDASAGRIRRAVRRLIEEPQFAAAARRLGGRIRAEADGGEAAARAILRLGGQRRRSVSTAGFTPRSSFARLQAGGPNAPRASAENP